MNRHVYPPWQVFEEAYPAAHEWAAYEAYNPSRFWAGTLTTVDNPWYGVKGGMKLRVLLIQPRWIPSHRTPPDPIPSHRIPMKPLLTRPLLI